MLAPFAAPVASVAVLVLTGLAHRFERHRRPQRSFRLSGRRATVCSSVLLEKFSHLAFCARNLAAR
jgi:hypothetical protein